MNKIAVCISGETRTGLESAISFFKFFDIDVDIFYHTWETSPAIQQQLYNLYKPVRHKIEPQKESFNQNSFQSMLYSIMVANSLKKEEEIRNLKRYEIVIRTRFDAIYNPLHQFIANNIKERVLYARSGLLGFNPVDYEQHSIDDTYFYGDSVSLDTVSSTYKHFDKYCIPIQQLFKSKNSSIYTGDAIYSPGILQYKECIKRNIQIVDNNFIGPSIFRSDVKHLDPIINYEEIREFNMQYVKARRK